ncbi:RES domain-containing protein [Providencia rettgeri]|uniref:RES domain-containing protein n=3 Tax=Providencia rettgeri TaxID=587 RepID=A0AAP2K1W6_PRORE|nr:MULTISPECIES: HEPN-associated N-terminal domain-containing protein [Providencia]ELR5198584.1 RES domain-containing protein [Providencia rettgeri]MBX6955673.1 RES domain-containing protein [Providencia rettgeri]MBX6961093.1 RES domain-containing protein [Providencia rettgeri]MBX6973851.1 RES domain-containing protein [Providencia rettgeri]MBX6982738.1 RES domain-containing protein [Providencia rettgeri]
MQDDGDLIESYNHVCAECFGNQGIINLINDEEELKAEQKCDYCKKNNRKVVLLDLVLAHILGSIYFCYANPEEVAYRDKGEFITEKNLSTAEVLYELGLKCNNNKLFEDICSHIRNDYWCESQPYLSEKHEVLLYSWDSFSNHIKNKSRFVFFEQDTEPFDDQYFPPALILNYIGSAIKELSLFKTLQKDEPIYRCRHLCIDNKKYWNAKDLGTPLPKYTLGNPNRMNPQGIPMFYGSPQKLTAIKEIIDSCNTSDESKEFVTGIFYSTKELRLVDLTQSLDEIDYFDHSNQHLITSKLFLRKFIEIINKPITRSEPNLVYIEYIPTQVVTEYFKIILTDNNGHHMNGFQYKSSKDGEPCIVLFVTQDECDDDSNITNKTVLALKKIERDSNNDIKKRLDDGW